MAFNKCYYLLTTIREGLYKYPSALFGILLSMSSNPPKVLKKPSNSRKDMPRQTTLIPKAPLARVFKEAGAHRVSDSALTSLVELLSEVSEQVASKAIEIAKHRGSRTVNEGDIRLALK